MSERLLMLCCTERRLSPPGSLAVLAGLLIVTVKVVGGLVALWLAHLGRGHKLRRPLLLTGGLGSGLLIIYGGLLVAVGTWRSNRSGRLVA